MAAQTGTSRRIQQALQHVLRKEWEAALVNLFPAIDATAKRRRPNEKVGPRIRAFLDDEHGLISVVATSNYFGRIEVDGVTIPDALYKFGRTSLMHEGELDPRLQFNEGGVLSAGTDNWNLPISYIHGMVLAVVVAPENLKESITGSFRATVLGEEMRIEDLWGKREMVRRFIAQKFNNPGLFSTSTHPAQSQS